MLTKSIALAFERAQVLLPNLKLDRVRGSLEESDPTKALWNMSYDRVKGPMRMSGSTAQCLCHIITAATTPIDRGGFGKTLEDVQKVVGLHPTGASARGLGAHHEGLLQRLARVEISEEAVKNLRAGNGPVRSATTNGRNTMATTKKAAAKKSPAKSASKDAKKPRAKKGEGTGPRWSLGLFRSNKSEDRFTTCYVTVDGVPMPYEQPRVAGQKILFHKTYTGMTFKEARQQLMKDAAKAGVGVNPDGTAKGSAGKAAKGAAKKDGKAAAKKTPAKGAAKKSGARKSKGSGTSVESDADAGEPAEAAASA